MNKQGMWFLTLFSLILVLSVYYITMPNELLMQNNSGVEATFGDSSNDNQDDVKVTIEESDMVIALKVSHEESIQEEIQKLESTMLLDTATSLEKNEAYEQIKYLTNIQGMEEKLEEIIRNVYKIDNFIEIDNSTIKVVAAKEKHDVTLAQNIMQTIQNEFQEKKYITVRFN